MYEQLKTLMIPISTNRFCDWGIGAFYLLAPNRKNRILRLLKGNQVSTNLRVGEHAYVRKYGTYEHYVFMLTWCTYGTYLSIYIRSDMT
jgi:hypothetical protein